MYKKLKSQSAEAQNSAQENETYELVYLEAMVDLEKQEKVGSTTKSVLNCKTKEQLDSDFDAIFDVWFQLQLKDVCKYDLHYQHTDEETYGATLQVEISDNLIQVRQLIKKINGVDMVEKIMED